MGDPGEIFGFGSDTGEKRTGDKNQELSESIREIESKMGSVADVDFTELKGKLFYAKMMLEGGCYDVANEMVGICQEMLDKRLLRYDLLMKTIEKAKREILVAKESEGDTEEAEKLLEEAENCLKEGEYQKGVTHALKSVEAAKGEADKYKSWRTELDSWSE